MSSIESSLFTEFKSKKLNLSNRIVMAPMTRSFSPNGVPGNDVAAYYQRRTEGGVSLIVTEGTTIDHESASPDPKVPRFHGADALAGWQKVVDAVHGAGGKIVPQLWHVGMARNAEVAPNPERPNAGPSGILHDGKQVAEPLSHDEVRNIIAAYASAAKSAQDLGFDGVEIHGAHGYLVDQFFWKQMNIRDDEFGGDQVQRVHFGAEIVAAVRAATSEDFPIIFRLSQWKQQDFEAKLAQSPDELEVFLQPLVDAGVDIFHCSTRRYWEPEFEDSSLNLAGWIKKLTGLPTITVGSVGLTGDMMTSFMGQGSGKRAIDDLDKMLNNEEFDLVAVGRALIQDANWPNKVRDGKLDELQDYQVESLATLD